MILLGLGGGSGSGKSWLAAYLKRRLGSRATIFCLDWYYKNNVHLTPAQAKRFNFDHPRALDMGRLVADLRRLARGRPIEAPIYDYATHARLTRTQRIEPAPVILIEGLFVLQDARLRRLLDGSVHIDVPDDVRLLRRVRRDVNIRRIDLEETLQLYERCVRPMYLRFIAPSARRATWVWRQLEDPGFPRRLSAWLARRSRAAGRAAPGQRREPLLTA